MKLRHTIGLFLKLRCPFSPVPLTLFSHGSFREDPNMPGIEHRCFIHMQIWGTTSSKFSPPKVPAIFNINSIIPVLYLFYWRFGGNSVDDVPIFWANIGWAECAGTAHQAIRADKMLDFFHSRQTENSNVLDWWGNGCVVFLSELGVIIALHLLSWLFNGFSKCSTKCSLKGHMF